MYINSSKSKDIRISLRLSSCEEKSTISELASDLGMNLSEFIKAKIFGKNLTDEYIELIKQIIENDEFEYEYEPFTLKKILKNHWEFMSSGDYKYLIEKLIELIEDDEFYLDIEVFKISKKGKVKFIKTSYIDSDIKQFILDRYENQ